MGDQYKPSPESLIVVLPSLNWIHKAALYGFQTGIRRVAW